MTPSEKLAREIADSAIKWLLPEQEWPEVDANDRAGLESKIQRHIEPLVKERDKAVEALLHITTLPHDSRLLNGAINCPRCWAEAVLKELDATASAPKTPEL